MEELQGECELSCWAQSLKCLYPLLGPRQGLELAFLQPSIIEANYLEGESVVEPITPFLTPDVEEIPQVLHVKSVEETVTCVFYDHQASTPLGEVVTESGFFYF